MNKFCRDCKHSMPEPGSEWNLKCMHPVIIQSDNYALASTKPNGTPCSNERAKHWPFVKCGRIGALWEAK